MPLSYSNYSSYHVFSLEITQVMIRLPRSYHRGIFSVLIVDACFMRLSVVDIAPWDLPPYQKLNAWFEMLGVDQKQPCVNHNFPPGPRYFRALGVF